MVKSKELSIEIRNLIVKKHLEGYSYAQISAFMEISKTTIASIVQKYRNSGTTGNAIRLGRPNKLKDRTKRLIKRQILTERSISAGSICANLNIRHSLVVSSQSVRNAIHEFGFKGRVPRKKPYVSLVNKRKRLAYAKKHKDKPLEYWKKVLFTDESLFSISSGRSKSHVYRKPEEEYHESCLQPTFKSGSANLMIWGCMSMNGVGKVIFCEESINSSYYQTILGANLGPSKDLLGLPEDYILLQDNAPAHSSRSTREFLREMNVQVLDHPPQSPDLNPIEHLWEFIDRDLKKNPARSVNDLKDKIQNIWQNIPSSMTRILVESMPRRMEAVIASKGGVTKY